MSIRDFSRTAEYILNAQQTFSFQKWPHVKNFWKTNEGVEFLLMTTLPIKSRDKQKQMIKKVYKSFSNRSDNWQKLWHSPIKNKTHELKIECAGKTLELDPTGGVLFTLTGLAIVAIITVQLLLLNSTRNNTLRPSTSDLHWHMELSGKEMWGVTLRNSVTHSVRFLSPWMFNSSS